MTLKQWEELKLDRAYFLSFVSGQLRLFQVEAWRGKWKVFGNYHWQLSKGAYATEAEAQAVVMTLELHQP